MTVRVSVDADVEFSVEVGAAQMQGRLRGSGTELVLTVSDPDLLGGSGTAPARVLADGLAEQGLTLQIAAAGRPLVTLGVPRTSFVQRRVTGSRHIALASPGAALTLLRLRRATGRRTPLVPPGTPLPLVPTFLRRPRRATTTHDPDRGGYPRLVMASHPHPSGGHHLPDGARERRVFSLGEVTTIGSHPSCDVVLPDLEARHAEIRRTEDDELVLVRLAPAPFVRVNGAPVATQALLRTGTRVELAGHTLVYMREEYADHGRPYGGRVGGELGRQRLQPAYVDLRRPSGGDEGRGVVDR